MKRFVTEEIELDPESVVKLQELAEEYNTTVDNVVSEILVENISTKITVEEFTKLLEDIDEGKKEVSKLQEYYTIVDEKKNPIARCIPI